MSSYAFQKVIALRRDVLRKFRQVGFLSTVRHISVRLLGKLSGLLRGRAKVSDAFDLEYGTDTAEEVTVGALGIPEAQLAQTNKYQAVGVDIFMNVIGDLPIRHSEYRFLDLGSGKGRALLLASFFPFKEVIGVELSEPLHEIARRNIEIFRSERQRCKQVQSICADAGKFEIPEGSLVVYMYNSFGPEVLRAVLSHIQEALRTQSRKLCIVYANPLHRSVLDETEFLQLSKQGNRYVIYEPKSQLNG